MKNLTALIALALPLVSLSQTAMDYGVLLQTEAQGTSAIRLTWNADANATGYSVYRKAPHETVWGTPLAFPAVGDTEYVDNTITANTEYEYSVRRTTATHTAYGYTHSAAQVEPTPSRGGLLLVVADSVALQLPGEVAMLIADIEADGWRVDTIVASESGTAAGVKSRIMDKYNSAQKDLQMVYLLGHVPVPYSGNINPDAHPDHQGAWPADVYYADVDGLWKDANVNTSTASDPRNHNTPGDGKFDNSVLPSAVDLMIGRVDFANMPAFAYSEMELLKRYLDRAHAFKHAEWTLPKRALVDDHFGGFNGEAFANNGWRNFSPLVGRDNILAGDYRTTLAANGHLFSYGCGGGTYTSAGGIGTTAQFATDSLLTAFTMLFGSYFGDWDCTDNFMRAALAQGTTLGISWAGRPHWFYQSMGIGHPIGYAAKATQNNANLYTNTTNYSPKYVHIALLGDPTLRMEYLAPPTTLTVDSVDTFHIALNWQPSPETGVAYNIYRKLSEDAWEKVAATPVGATSFVDSCVLDSGQYAYIVKAVRLVENFSGSYYNESLGATGSIDLFANKHPRGSHKSIDGINFPVILFIAHPQWATSVSWYLPSEDTVLFGDSIRFETTLSEYTPHPYRVIFQNSCEIDTLSGVFKWTWDWGVDEHATHSLNIFPNPVQSGQEMHLTADLNVEEIAIYGLDGSLVRTVAPQAGAFKMNVARGVYIIRATSGDSVQYTRLVVQ